MFLFKKINGNVLIVYLKIRKLYCNRVIEIGQESGFSDSCFFKKSSTI